MVTVAVAELKSKPPYRHRNVHGNTKQINIWHPSSYTPIGKQIEITPRSNESGGEWRESQWPFFKN